MELDTYTFENENDDLFSYSFVSKGKNGNIIKIVQFTLMENGESYNLSLGDYQPETSSINYDSISNNGDMNIVFTTISNIVIDFLSKFPKKYVFATGNTNNRTRLYRTGLSKYQNQIKEHFFLLGRKDGEWQIFEKEENYEAFLIKKI